MSPDFTFMHRQAIVQESITRIQCAESPDEKLTNGRRRFVLLGDD